MQKIFFLLKSIQNGTKLIFLHVQSLNPTELQ